MSTHDSDIILSHQPCPDCGSSDALAQYSDGHTYCFSCRRERQGTKPENPRKEQQRKWHCR